MAMCKGSRKRGIETEAGKQCPVCGKEFSNDSFTDRAKNIPVHSTEFIEEFDDISYGGTE
jgi:DNA repair exonuclease SbcCD ATPase subunit